MRPQYFSDEYVPWTEAAAAAAVCKYDKARGVLRYSQHRTKGHRSAGDVDVSFKVRSCCSHIDF